jgi:hypothetical protein
MPGTSDHPWQDRSGEDPAWGPGGVERRRIGTQRVAYVPGMWGAIKNVGTGP